MWNEVYAPKCDADLAWSREKKRALLERVRGVCDGTQPPGIHLLYGPTGCGKLSALRVLFADAVRLCCGLQTEGGASPEDSFRVFHTCDAPMLSYQQFLHHVLLHFNTETIEAALPLRAASSATPTLVEPSCARTMAGGTNSATDESRPRAFVIKFYGEAASECVQQRCTADFVTRYVALRDVALRSDHHDGAASRAAAQSLLQRLRRCFVFFIHTTHDTHDDKVDLAASFPASVLGSAALIPFHCTPITQLNMRRRLCQIVEYEAQRRGLSDSQTGTSGAASLSTSRARHERRTCGTRRSISRGVDTTADRRPRLLSDADLDVLVTSSQGDLRQALLQAQWTMLVPPSSTSPPRYKDDANAVITTSGDAVRRLLDAVGGQRARSDAQDAARPHSAMTASDDVAQDACGDDDDEVVCVAARMAPSRRILVKRPRTVLDLVDEAETRASSRARDTATTGAMAALSITRLAVTAVRDEYVGLAHATARLLTQKHSLSSVLDVLNVSPHKLLGYLMNNLPNYFSNEQIANYASCAAAGSTADAMQARESFGMVGGDGIAGFRSRAGVTGDGAAPVRTADPGPTAASPRQLQVMSLWLFDLTYRTAQTTVHIPRTFAAQRPPPLQRCAYPRTRTLPRQRRISDEVAMTGVSPAIPATSTVDEAAWRAPFWSELDWHRGFLTRLRMCDERYAANFKVSCVAAGQVTLPGLTSEEADIVREGLPSLLDRCGALDAIVLDYVPFARRIVLVEQQQRQPNTSTPRDMGVPVQSTLPSWPAAEVAPGVATASAQHGGPRRTMFRLAPAASPSHYTGTRRRRLCSELQYRILRCGLPPTTARLRDGYFELSAMTEEERQSRLHRDEDDGCHGTAGLPGGLPHRRDVVDEIEECSD